MSYFELLGLVGVMATILGVSLAVYGLINNRTLKEESRLTRVILDRIDSHIAEVAEFTKRGFKDVIADNAQTRSLIKTT